MMLCVKFNLCEDFPDESMMFKFCHLLEKHKLGSILFATINKGLVLEELSLKEGGIFDATITCAPTLTKNKSGIRGPEMVQ